MEKLIEQMKVTIATVFSFYLKAHAFHWNVEGPNFVQYHQFLGDIYEDVFGSVDKLAEELRTLDSYVPGSLKRFSELSKIDDQLNIPSANAMMKELFLDNMIVISNLEKAEKLASENNKLGLSNLLQDRIDVHNKHKWMLSSIIKG